MATDVCWRGLGIGQQRHLLTKARFQCQVCKTPLGLSIHCGGITNQVDMHKKNECVPVILCGVCHLNNCALARNMEGG